MKDQNNPAAQSYLDVLRSSAEETGSIVCMGLDPILEYLPEQTGHIRSDLNRFYRAVFRNMQLQGVFPGAFKPNIGYFQALDKPRDEDFSGSLALVDLFDMLENFFPGIPVILDSKRGDIARSSRNYAMEAFEGWKAQAVTISPYMGSDSVKPFLQYSEKGCGTYILNRTSNPGGADVQTLDIHVESNPPLSQAVGESLETIPLYMELARKITNWAKEFPGTGAVVGATSLDELEKVAGFYAPYSIPLLIPGVGSQGGSGAETVMRLKKAGYELSLARINSSSGITHPWKDGPIPEDWEDVVVDKLKDLQDEISGALK